MECCRVAVVGNSGSGKSTLASLVADKLHATFVELDDFAFLPGWRYRPTAEFRGLVDDALSADGCWTTAGNWSPVCDIVYQRADTIVWIDFGFWRTFWQLFRRTVWRAWAQPAICGGNYESCLLSFFSVDSVLLDLCRRHSQVRAEFTALFSSQDERPGVRFVRLDSPASVETWLAQLTTKHG
mmetsp:Transcript_90884/g.266092  ORF Transcript_90884/g.266092 Transcript_90884/m.266092 type:complete len:183 (-) Transcript_90884:132-680(-)